jgi:hypothetical protein
LFAVFAPEEEYRLSKQLPEEGPTEIILLDRHIQQL